MKGNLKKDIDRLAYCFSGGPYLTDEALVKAREALSDPVGTTKRAIVKELEIEAPGDSQGRERER